VIGIENARRVGFAGSDRAGVVKQLTELLDRIAHVGTQHVFAEELVKHLPDRALEKRHAAAVPRTVPRVGAVLRVIHQRLEEGWRQPGQIRLGLADDVPRHELGRVLEHVDEAV
jgi:hypothetical protein